MVVVVFPTSGYPYLILCPRQCKWKVAATCLAIRTKNNYDIWVWKSPAIKASTNYKKQHQTLWTLRKKTIILSYLSEEFPDKVN